MKKILVLFLVLLLPVVALLAGGSQDKGSAEKATINLWDPVVRPGAKEARDGFIDWFEAKHSNIDVVHTVVPWAQLNDKLLAAMATNTLPDLFLSWSSFPPSYFDQGVTQDVTDVIKEIGFDQFSDAAKRVSSKDNKWFAVPFVVVPHVMFYRSDWARQKGLGAPKTWDDWYKMAQAFTEGDRYGIVGYLGANEPYYLTNVRATAGGTFFDRNLNVTVDTEPWLESLRFVKRLWKFAQPGATTISQTDARVIFTEGGGGVLATSVSFANVIGQKDEKMLEDISSVPIPRNPKFKSDFGGFGPNAVYLLMSKTVKNRDAAKLYCVEFMSHENHLKYTQETAIGWVAVRKSVQTSPEYINYPRLKPYKSFIDAALAAEPGGLNLGHPYGPNKYGGVVFGKHVELRMIQKLIDDNMSPEEVAKWGQKQVEEIKKELD